MNNKKHTDFNLNSAGYFFKQTMRSLYMNRLMTATSIITVFSSVLILVISYTLLANINFMVNSMEENISFVLFLNDDVPAEDATTILDELKADKNFSDVTYSSKEDALNSMKEDFADDTSFFDGLENDNPLPRSFVVTLTGDADPQKVLKSLEDQAGEEEGKRYSSIQHAKFQTELLSTLSRGITIVGFSLMIILGFIAVIIIMNTIRITVNFRKQEIGIMKYIGATDSFIRIPFILEGVFVGFAGALLPPIICFVSYDYMLSVLYSKAPYVEEIMGFKPSVSVFVEVFPLALLLGISLGVIGSAVTIRKHLHV